jgi:hypothetical protein
MKEKQSTPEETEAKTSPILATNRKELISEAERRYFAPTLEFDCKKPTDEVRERLSLKRPGDVERKFRLYLQHLATLPGEYLDLDGFMSRYWTRWEREKAIPVFMVERVAAYTKRLDRERKAKNKREERKAKPVK